MDRSTIAILGALGISLVIAVLGIVFMLMQKPFYDLSGQEIRIEVPFFGKLQTNFPAIGAFFIAASLAAGVVWMALAEPDRFPILANVRFQGLDAGPRDIVIGIIPGSNLVVNSLSTTPESISRTISVVDGENSYTGLAYVREAGKPLLSLGAVTVENGTATFDARLEP